MIYKVLSTLMFFNFILCMDKKESKPNNASFALSIALRNGIKDFDHTTICSCAINKECEKALLETAKLRKEHFTKLMSSNTHKYRKKLKKWYKYGSAYTQESLEYSHAITVFLYYLTSTEKGWGYNHIHWNKNIWIPITNFEKPQFNSKGDCLLYVVENTVKSKELPNYQVYEYTISSSNKNKTKICRVALKKDGSAICDLLELVSFPAVFKAVLMSKVIGENGSLKVYSLPDTIIPHNYKDWHKHANFTPEYNSFEDLPEEIKTAIESTYKKQNHKRSMV